MKTKLFAFFCFLLILYGNCCQAQTSATDSLFNCFRNAKGFDYNYPREKVYLHLDNNAYFEEETIWFKAYVVRASSLKPQPLSRVLYVELLSDAGVVMQRKLLRIDSLGQANGEFDLELPIRSGYYEVRAYTREMTNWGTEACFSRVVPVYKMKDKGTIDEIRLSEMPSKTSRVSPRPNGVLDSVKNIVEFYPEGGNRVSGVNQRVAFRLTNGRGLPNLDILHIRNEAGEEITTAQAGHEGFGTFILPSNANEGLYATVGNGKKKYPLPDTEPQQHYVMTVNNFLDGHANVVIQANGNATPHRLLGVAVMCRETPTYFDTLTISPNEAIELELSPASFRTGVNRIELFDASGQSIASRLVWHGRYAQDVNVEVKQNEKVYKPFSPVALELYLKDAQGKPVSTTFSLAVRDDNGEVVADERVGIATDLLLSSELKGYVHRPSYYFEADDETHLRDLDNLMLVQGWTANSFSDISGFNAFTPKEPIEEKLTLNGTVYRENNKRQPYPNMQLDIKMYSSEGGALSAECITDSAGRFAFVSNEDYVGNWIAQFSTKDGKDKRRWSRIAIDRWFVPQPRPLTGIELFQPKAVLWEDSPSAGNSSDIHTFAWKDTIPRFVGTHLGEAVVVRFNKYKGLTGGRYTYGGGEKYGMRHAVMQYNVTMEVEREKDAGGAVGYFHEFMAKIDPQIRYGTYYPDNHTDTGSAHVSMDTSVSETLNSVPDELPITLYYRNRNPQIFFNNNTSPVGDLQYYMADEIKSVSILKNGSNGTAIDPSKMEGKQWGMFIYEIPDYFRYLEKRGINKRRVTGYSRPKRFYSPSYRGLDVPSDEDVRRTLFWDANVVSDKNGKATAVFFSNCRENQHLRISLRGITSQGLFIDFDQ